MTIRDSTGRRTAEEVASADQSHWLPRPSLSKSREESSVSHTQQVELLESEQSDQNMKSCDHTWDPTIWWLQNISLRVLTVETSLRAFRCVFYKKHAPESEEPSSRLLSRLDLTWRVSSHWFSLGSSCHIHATTASGRTRATPGRPQG